MERFSRRTISVSEGRRRSHNQEERGRFIFGSSNDWDICPFLFPYTSSTSSLSFLLLLLHLLNLHPFHLSDIILQKYSPPSSSTSPSPASPPVQCPGVFGSGGGGHCSFPFIISSCLPPPLHHQPLHLSRCIWKWRWRRLHFSFSIRTGR